MNCKLLEAGRHVFPPYILPCASALAAVGGRIPSQIDLWSELEWLFCDLSMYFYSNYSIKVSAIHGIFF